MLFVFYLVKCDRNYRFYINISNKHHFRLIGTLAFYSGSMFILIL